VVADGGATGEHEAVAGLVDEPGGVEAVDRIDCVGLLAVLADDLGDRPGSLPVVIDQKVEDEPVYICLGGGSVEGRLLIRHGRVFSCVWASARVITPRRGRLVSMDAGDPTAGSDEWSSCAAARSLLWLALARLQQDERVDADLAGDALQALESQVALAALDAAHVGAVDAELVGEVLLAEALGLSVGPEVAADGALEVAFHAGTQSRFAT
jgi:hypothetical protein